MIAMNIVKLWRKMLGLGQRKNMIVTVPMKKKKKRLAKNKCL